MSSEDLEKEIERAIIKRRCERDHLFFTRYFFKIRFGSKFKVNWHHRLISREVDKVITGQTQNLIINISPGSSKTELVIINLMARGLAINPRARFIHLSYSDDLALLNSQTARDIVGLEEYQTMWPRKLSVDTKSKKRWNIVFNDKHSGGVYATSINGQVAGFRAGHMSEGFMGAILIDDPIKPEDGFSKHKIDLANRKLISTVKSRKANPKTPIIVVMQRVAENDPTGFIENGGLPGLWKIIKIPALLDEETVQRDFKEFQEDIDKSEIDDQGRFSYWEYKEPVKELASMEKGDGKDQTGNQVSRFVFSSQWQQRPRAVGGNLIHGDQFVRYRKLPIINYRKIFADTAQKTAERNDRSVFECWGRGDDGKIYLLDLIKGKWEAPELLRRARSFWTKHKSSEFENLGQLREIKIEDKSSGTGLIQTLGIPDKASNSPAIPIKAIPRTKDKLTRVLDMMPYIEAGLVCIPEDAPFVSDFLDECEAFTADDTHEYDDQIDACLDAIDDMLSSNNKMKTWEALGDG
jgi:predicted phage terminase large subunit-like protein